MLLLIIKLIEIYISLLQVTSFSFYVISSNDTNEVSIILKDFPHSINTFISIIGITNESHEYFSYTIVENDREATKNILFIIIFIIIILLILFYGLLFVLQ